MRSTFGHYFSKDDYASYFGKLGVAFEPLADIDPKYLADIEANWANYEKDYGMDWSEVQIHAMAFMVDMPGILGKGMLFPMDLVIAYEVDPISYEVAVDGEGLVTRVPLASEKTMPTAYYETIAMYILSTGAGS
jgi:hypothetical protein